MAAAPTVYFYGQNDDRGEFSNFYRVGFVHQGARYTSSEQAMMHRKALFFGDDAVAVEILKENNPLACKRLGRMVTPYNDARWAEVRYDVVCAILEDKFGQNPGLRAKLLATGDADIAEASPRDRVWGTGMGKERASQGEPWSGQNLLGKALMATRAALRHR